MTGMTQLLLDGGSITIIPSSNTVWEMPVVHNWCDNCAVNIAPVTMTDGETWITYPCHEEECSGCYGIATCEACTGCDDCCSCDVCESCNIKTDYGLCDECETCEGCCECVWCYGDHKFDPNHLVWCEHCECCEHHCDCSQSSLTPGWIERGWSTAHSADAHVLMADHLSRIAPSQAMADFYLCEYVALVANLAKLPEIAMSAKVLQDSIVRDCDDAFRDYVFLAIGGEARHHASIRGAMPTGRESAWDWWLGMGERYGRLQLIRDAVELFEDRDGWQSSYGGEAWAISARVLLSREDGRLDAFTFVDRVFSLQHNTGSLLNKSRWQNPSGVRNMQDIGEAHKADRINLHLLTMEASDNGRELLTMLPANIWEPFVIHRGSGEWVSVDSMVPSTGVGDARNVAFFELSQARGGYVTECYAVRPLPDSQAKRDAARWDAEYRLEAEIHNDRVQYLQELSATSAVALAHCDCAVCEQDGWVDHPYAVLAGMVCESCVGEVCDCEENA